MTDTKIMSLALKVLGVYSIIRATEYLGQVSFAFGLPPSLIIRTFNVILTGALPMAFLLTVAFVLIRYSEGLARKLFPSNETISTAIQNPGIEWYALVITVVGVVLLLWKVPEYLAQLVVNLSIQDYTGLPGGREGVMRATWALGIKAALQTAIGLYLVFGSKRIAEILHKLKRD